MEKYICVGQLVPFEGWSKYNNHQSKSIQFERIELNFLDYIILFGQKAHHLFHNFYSFYFDFSSRQIHDLHTFPGRWFMTNWSSSADIQPIDIWIWTVLEHYTSLLHQFRWFSSCSILQFLECFRSCYLIKSLAKFHQNTFALARLLYVGVTNRILILDLMDESFNLPSLSLLKALNVSL